MRHFISVAFLVVILPVSVLSAACSRVTPPTAPSAVAGGSTAATAAISGVTWTLEQFTDARGAAVSIPASATFSITLIDGRLAIQSDCNRCSGGATAGNGSLDVGLLACTRAACSSSPVDTQFESTLSGTHAVTATASNLRLASPRGVLDFTR